MSTLRNSLLAFGLGVTSLTGVSASEQSVSLDQAATCAGMSVTLDRLVAEQGRFRNRIAHMEVDRSNVSSVDVYNDLVAASNVLVKLSNPLIQDYNPKCGAVSLSRTNYAEVCSGANGATSFCRSFGFENADEVNVSDQLTNPMAVRANFGADTVISGGRAYAVQKGAIPVEGDLFPRLNVSDEGQVQAVPVSEDRRVQRFPRDGYR